MFYTYIPLNNNLNDKLNRPIQCLRIKWFMKFLFGNDVSQIGFQLEVLVGSTAEVASNAAKEFQATRLILVRSVSNFKSFCLAL